MLNLIQTEWYKLKKQRGYKIILGVNALIYLLLGVLLSSGGVFTVSVSSVEESMETAPMIINGYDAFFTSLVQLASNGVLISIFVGLFVCNDFSHRTIGAMIASGKSRLSFLTAKTLVVLVAVLPILCITPLTMTLITTIENGFGVAFTQEVFFEMLRGFLLYLVTNGAITLFYVLVAFLTKNMGSTVAISTLCILLFSFVQALPLIETLTTVLQCTPFYWALSIRSITEFSEIVQTVLTSVACLALCFGLSFLLLRRAELK